MIQNTAHHFPFVLIKETYSEMLMFIFRTERLKPRELLVENHLRKTEERRPFILGKWNDNGMIITAYGSLLWDFRVGRCDNSIITL